MPIESGRNWNVDGKVFTVFGLSGLVEGNEWIMPAGHRMEAVKPRPVGRRVRGIIARAERSGKTKSIAYVGVSAYAGLQLMLDGIITVDVLRKSTENPDDRIVCSVTIGGKKRKLVILHSTRYYMAVYDEHDQVL
jgi:hypothetical protein